ncbi:Putative drug/metabolite transporter (DMT) superfamily permease [Magnetospirillum sp. XM-1]|uniref:EamA family transporter n=1 Tax=Magnetospirillum sp. XM-1 TaxID=1663591 RepID=UPI00073DC5C9|nr:EamA family transporter [Magnetospirillum sp. XM-1]CUW38012.1 Putative drug/metabolite transporter (DMT) superfamily permease [Magnetospirillum sp. XM-1]
MMDSWTFGLVLLAALLHASWNTLIKVSHDKLAMQALVCVGAGLAALPAALFVPLPDAACLPFLAVSLVVHVIYCSTLVLAYHNGDLSLVYPVARGSAPALVALGAWLVAGEAGSSAEVAGVALISAAIVGTAVTPLLGRNATAGETRALALALATAVGIAAYSVIDGLGVRRTTNAISYVLWLHILEAVPLMSATLWLRRKALAQAFPRRALITGLGGGVVSLVAYGIVIWAMQSQAMAHVAALRETSVILAAAIGALALGEPFGRRRVAAAFAVCCGAALIHWG